MLGVFSSFRSNPPFVIGFALILCSFFGGSCLNGSTSVPFSSNSFSGWYDFNHFSSSFISFSFVIFIGTWCALNVPSILFRFTSFGPVQPFGLFIIMIGNGIFWPCFSFCISFNAHSREFAIRLCMSFRFFASTMYAL